MTFNATQIKDETNASMNAMLMLNSSCQAIIQSSINQVDTPWYTDLSNELKAAEELVVNWRKNGFLYFKTAILEAMTNTGQQFIAVQGNLDALYAQLNQQFSQNVKDQIVQEIQNLAAPIQNLTSQIDEYSGKLTDFQKSMNVVHQNMNTTIKEVQNQEANIKIEIDQINSQIADLQNKITTYRNAIAKAKSTRTSGILETIFGIFLAPFTFGASLILAGVGVASIAEAESDINNLENTISDYQKSITADQTNLSNDQKIVATLNSILMGTDTTLNDMDMIGQALQELRISWASLDTELGQIITKTNNAQNSADALVGQAWFDAACLEWETIIPHSQDLSDRTIQSKFIQIGN